MKIFVTGTDTNVGKTYISIGLLKIFNQLGYSTVGIKPVASGCFRKGDEFYNSDAIALWQHSSIKLDYFSINPFRFVDAVSPNIAAAKENITLNVKNITTKIKPVLNYSADIHLIEGVGGWFVPLNNNETMADFVASHKLPILLVVDLRLGCLNHTLLTYQAIKNANLKLYGWVANCVQPNIQNIPEMTNTLCNWLEAPCFGIVNYQMLPEQILNFNSLLSKLGSLIKGKSALI